MHVATDEITDQLDRITASAAFARAGRLARFLRFVVEETLAGRGERVKEYAIAIEVFGRPSSYDPQVDSLVRVQASQLRAKLRQYYETEGSAESIRIEIPKGGYSPVFHRIGPTPPRGRRWIILAAASAAILLLLTSGWLLSRVYPVRPGPNATAPSVAVMPFADMSPGHDQAYLCDGIAEELIHSLGRIQGLRVVARASAFQYQGQSIDVRRIGRELKVRSVVEGSVRRDGDNLRVNAELINTADGYSVWHAEFTRRLNDTFAVEEEIAKSIAGRLQPDRTQAGPRTTMPNPQAYQHYLVGNYWRTNPSAEHIRKAIAEFRAALTADPGYAQAEAALAEAFARLHYLEVVPPAETMAAARAAAAKALTLDDQLARAHEAAALVHLMEWDAAGADREFRRALELDPADVRIRYAYAQLCLNPVGRHQEAMEQLRAALNLDPVARYLITELGSTYLMSGQPARARAEFERSLEFNPQAAGTRTNLAAVAAAEGRYAEALAVLMSVESEMPGDPWVEGQLGYAYAKAGRTAEARRVLAGLTAAKAVPALHVAAVYAGLGDADGALDWLNRGLAARAPSLYWLKTDFRFVALHADARFQRLAAQLP